MAAGKYTKYPKKGKYSKGSKKNTKFIKNSKTAGSQQKQILSVQRQVVALKNKVKDRAQYAQYFLELVDGVGVQFAQINLPNGEFYVNPLMRPSDFASKPIFQATATSDEPNKCIVKSFDIQLVFSPKNSLTALTPRIIRVWTVSLRKETAQEVLQGTAL